MKYTLIMLFSAFVFFANAQDKSLIKDVKETGRYIEDALQNAETLLENVLDALNAIDYGEARMYVEQSVYELENMQATIGYAQDELLDINKISDDNGGIDIKLKAGEIEDKCLVVQSNSNRLYAYFNDALISTDLTDLLMKFGAARTTCEEIIAELKRALETHESLTVMVNPEE